MAARRTKVKQGLRFNAEELKARRDKTNCRGERNIRISDWFECIGGCEGVGGRKTSVPIGAALLGTQRRESVCLERIGQHRCEALPG